MFAPDAQQFSRRKNVRRQEKARRESFADSQGLCSSMRAFWPGKTVWAVVSRGYLQTKVKETITMSISVGAVGTASTVVTPENTAAAVGSGALPVFATPYMIALMENAACNAIADGLEEGQSSVGTKLDVSHDAATPVGMHVTAKAELVEVDRRRLVFRVTAEDDAGPIGQGTHERFLIMADKFLAKAEAKKG
jgi:fluoroacetyl-CoA thioesterase